VMNDSSEGMMVSNCCTGGVAVLGKAPLVGVAGGEGIPAEGAGPH